MFSATLTEPPTSPAKALQRPTKRSYRRAAPLRPSPESAPSTGRRFSREVPAAQLAPRSGHVLTVDPESCMPRDLAVRAGQVGGKPKNFSNFAYGRRRSQRPHGSRRPARRAPGLRGLPGTPYLRAARHEQRCGAGCSGAGGARHPIRVPSPAVLSGITQIGMRRFERHPGQRGEQNWNGDPQRKPPFACQVWTGYFRAASRSLTCSLTFSFDSPTRASSRTR
jgi:hypothetical protein